VVEASVQAWRQLKALQPPTRRRRHAARYHSRVDADAFPPDRCPLCGAANACAMERQRLTGQPQPPCWCTEVDFRPELLARVPPLARRRACICAACASAAPAPD
jgi:hypothetical protein